MKNWNTIRSARAQRREGSAFIVVMFVAFMLMAFGMLMTSMANSASYRVRKNAHSVQAQALAESGAAHMLAALGTNYYYWKDKSLTGSIAVGGATGTYTVSSTPVGGNILVDSTATLLGETRATTLEVLGTEKDYLNSLWPSNSQILADDYVILSATAMDINGDIHSNADVLEGPGNPRVHGSISAVGIIQVTPDGAVIEHAPRREIPYFNFEAYRQMAMKGGIYFSNSVDVGGMDLRPANGIVYCNGNFEIGNNSSLIGVLVANGNITVNNRFDQSQFIPGMPALLATGHVGLRNRNNYVGVIFGGLSVESDNRKTVRGGIISGGWVDIKNDMTTYGLPEYPLWDPADTNAPDVVVGGWLR